MAFRPCLMPKPLMGFPPPGPFPSAAPSRPLGPDDRHGVARWRRPKTTLPSSPSRLCSLRRFDISGGGTTRYPKTAALLGFRRLTRDFAPDRLRYRSTRSPPRLGAGRWRTSERSCLPGVLPCRDRLVPHGTTAPHELLCTSSRFHLALLNCRCAEIHFFMRPLGQPNRRPMAPKVSIARTTAGTNPPREPYDTTVAPPGGGAAHGATDAGNRAPCASPKGYTRDLRSPTTAGTDHRAPKNATAGHLPQPIPAGSTAATSHKKP